MPPIFKSDYVARDLSYKLLAAATAGISGYFAWRKVQSTEFITQSRQNDILEAGDADLYTRTVGTYDREAPILNELVNWWRLRQTEVETLRYRFDARLKGILYALGDAAVPLFIGAASLWAGFGKEFQTFGRVVSRNIPKADWSTTTNQLAAIAGTLVNGGIRAIRQAIFEPASQLFQRAPLATSLMAALGILTLNKLDDLASGKAQKDSLMDDQYRFSGE